MNISPNCKMDQHPISLNATIRSIQRRHARDQTCIQRTSTYLPVETVTGSTCAQDSMFKLELRLVDSSGRR